MPRPSETVSTLRLRHFITQKKGRVSTFRSQLLLACRVETSRLSRVYRGSNDGAWASPSYFPSPLTLIVSSVTQEGIQGKKVFSLALEALRHIKKGKKVKNYRGLLPPSNFEVENLEEAPTKIRSWKTQGEMYSLGTA